MTNTEATFRATAVYDGEVVGEIEEVPYGNIVEFILAHLNGYPWDPGQEADRVEVERVGELYE